MNMGSAIVIKKAGFLSALAYGFFGMLTATIVCGSGLAAYSLHIVDEKTDSIFGLAHSLVGSFPEMLDSLPPVLADALNDRRDPGYREFLDTTVTVVADNNEPGCKRVVVIVRNTGDKMVTLMSGHLVLEDQDGTPIREFSTYVATPIAVEDEWRGPLFPGSSRRFSYRLKSPFPAHATLEITDLRVWQGENS